MAEYHQLHFPILNTKEIRAKKDIFPAEEIKNDNISI